MTGEQSPTAEVEGPHGGQRVVTAGAPAGAAQAVVIALHGRGATAQGIINLLAPTYQHGVAFLAPQAARSRWYPAAPNAALNANERHLHGALGVVAALVTDAVDGFGVPRDHVVVLGFSQGGCIAAEYAARRLHSGPTVVLSGMLLGERIERDRYTGSLDGATVFLGCAAEDPYVPADRVQATADVFRALDGNVSEQLYEDAGHEVTDEEFDYISGLLTGLGGD